MSVLEDSYDELRALVVSGAIEPGVALPEIPLAARLGVSRPTVREALRRLESRGLAVADGRSLTVAAMPGDELRSALLTRAALEGLHAELAARRVAGGEIAPAQLRRLAALADDADAATRAGEYVLAVERNRAFHQGIDELADSPAGSAFLNQLWDRILVATRRSLDRSRAVVVDAEHRALLAALQSGDAKRARALAEAHGRGTMHAAGLGFG